MKAFYIKISTYGTKTPQIVDDEIIYQAERSMNYLNPDDFDFLCEAETTRDAELFYFDELSKQMLDCISEYQHP